MAHKTFISYKYSEAQELRDAIIKAMGEDASYYKGETSDSPDLTDTSTENIKKHLRDMMFDTSVNAFTFFTMINHRILIYTIFRYDRINKFLLRNIVVPLKQEGQRYLLEQVCLLEQVSLTGKDF